MEEADYTFELIGGRGKVVAATLFDRYARLKQRVTRLRPPTPDERGVAK